MPAGSTPGWQETNPALPAVSEEPANPGDAGVHAAGRESTAQGWRWGDMDACSLGGCTWLFSIFTQPLLTLPRL